MIDEKLREDLLKEVRRIGDWLLSLSKEEETGISWECLGLDANREITWEKSVGIYSGVSGIVLFFIELHRITGETKYKDAAFRGMRWVVDYCRKNPGSSFAFITGRMGVPYVLLRMAAVFGEGEDNWTQSALEIGKTCLDVLEGPHQVDDLINGSSGTLLSLLHLHAVTGEKWIIKAIEAYAEHLLSSAHPGRKKGLYWDHSAKNIDGLCGYSHGAAGLGHVFMELGHYFKNEAFYRVARQAFLYESVHFDSDKGNWLDLRNGMFSPEDEMLHMKMYLEDNREFFTTGNNMNAWCHGAAGIGLSRLRSQQLFKNASTAYSGADEFYLNEAMTAIATTKATDVDLETTHPLMILCHGGGGNADLFILAYNILGDKAYLDLASAVARKALTFYQTNNRYLCGFRDAPGTEDTSLFMGNAGIAYFYLRLLSPDDVPSILCPYVDSVVGSDTLESLSPDSVLRLSETGLTRKLLQTYYGRTLSIAERIIPGEVQRFFEGQSLSVEKEPLKHAFTSFIEEKVAGLDGREKDCLWDIFVMEREKIQMAEKIFSDSYFAAKEKWLRDQAEELIKLEGDEFLNLELKLEPEVILSGTDWNWFQGEGVDWAVNLDLEPDVYPLILRPLSFGILENQISGMTYTILSSFEEGCSVRVAQTETIEAFEDLTPEDVEMLRGKINEQIRQLLTAGILVKKDF